MKNSIVSTIDLFTLLTEADWDFWHRHLAFLWLSDNDPDCDYPRKERVGIAND
ncbi:MAG: hypothetical protein QNJ54_06310 [Prochloraceae cyanobacterium]|nr:hypothetical protein [Prochloraceae cyanobacterium]